MVSRQGVRKGHQRRTIFNCLNDRLTRLTTSRRSGAGELEEGDIPDAGELEEGDIPDAVVHGPGRSPVAGPEAAQGGIASEAHRSMAGGRKQGLTVAAPCSSLLA